MPHDHRIGQLVEEAFAFVYPTTKEERLESILSLLTKFKFTLVSGVIPIDTVLRDRTGNCLPLVCVLVSMLRETGFTWKEVFALIGYMKAVRPIAMHAYALVKNSKRDYLIAIDPQGMKPEVCTVEHFLSRHSALVLFNDHLQALTPPDIHQVLAATDR